MSASGRASGQAALSETAERLFRVDEGSDEPDDIVFLEGVPSAYLAAFECRTGLLVRQWAWLQVVRMDACAQSARQFVIPALLPLDYEV